MDFWEGLLIGYLLKGNSSNSNYSVSDDADETPVKKDDVFDGINAFSVLITALIVFVIFIYEWIVSGLMEAFVIVVITLIFSPIIIYLPVYLGLVACYTVWKIIRFFIKAFKKKK